MSTELLWQPINRYSVRSLGYTLCKVGSAVGWTFEVWKGREQLKVGLGSANEARAWCQRYHDEQLQKLERSNADAQQTQLLFGE